MSYTIDQIDVGMKASWGKTITENDVYMFAGASGDLNPAHINEEYAKGTFFKTRIAHGMLSASLVSTVLGNYLPGPGTIFISNSCNFLAPVYFGDTITATVEVVEKLPDGKKIRLKSSCVNQNGVTVLEGECVVSPPKARK